MKNLELDHMEKLQGVGWREGIQCASLGVFIYNTPNFTL